MIDRFIPIGRDTLIRKMKTLDKKFWVIIAILTVIGAGLRILCCFWGFPYQLHPDENVIIKNAIDMLSRHSWEAYIYNRPDQLEIKGNAILFSLFSWVKYREPAYVAFEQHDTAFYMLARFFTVVFGTAMIPMTALLVGRIFGEDKIQKKYIQLFAATIITFSSIYVQHSAYATPDIPLTFLVMLFVYCCSFYVERGEHKWLYIASVLMGMCVSIKYPAAILGIYIAVIVTTQAFKKKDFKEIFRMGFICICIVLITLFIISPNLFTDFGSVVEALTREARNSHVGADGLDFWGNLKYYFDTISNSLGILSKGFFVLGMIYLVKHRRHQHMALSVSAIFWVCLSCLGLHWLRWGIPMYISYIIVVALGMVWLMKGVLVIPNRYCKHAAGICVVVVVFISLCSILLSGLAITKYSLLPDTRVTSMQYCMENGISTNNSIYEGYTPLAPDYGPGGLRDGATLLPAFTIDGERIVLSEEYKDKEYLVYSSSFESRYINSAESYPEQAAFYKAIDANFELLYKLEGNNLGAGSPYEINNIVNNIKFLSKGKMITGNTIYIYDISKNTL